MEPRSEKIDAKTKNWFLLKINDTIYIGFVYGRLISNAEKNNRGLWHRTVYDSVRLYINETCRRLNIERKRRSDRRLIPLYRSVAYREWFPGRKWIKNGMDRPGRRV